MSIDPNKLKFIKSQADFGASVSAQSVQLLLTEIEDLRAVLAQEAGLGEAVAVVLPERREINEGDSDADQNSDHGWNACIDKVKELNQ